MVPQSQARKALPSDAHCCAPLLLPAQTHACVAPGVHTGVPVSGTLVVPLPLEHPAAIVTTVAAIAPHRFMIRMVGLRSCRANVSS